MLLQFPRVFNTFIKSHRNGEPRQNDMNSHLTEIEMESHLTEIKSEWPLPSLKGYLQIKSKRSAESRRSPSRHGLLRLPMGLLTDRHKYGRPRIEYIEITKKRRICSDHGLLLRGSSRKNHRWWCISCQGRAHRLPHDEAPVLGT